MEKKKNIVQITLETVEYIVFSFGLHQTTYLVENVSTYRYANKLQVTFQYTNSMNFVFFGFFHHINKYVTCQLFNAILN